MSRVRLLRGVSLLAPIAIAAILVWPDTIRALLAGEYPGAADFEVFYAGSKLFQEGRFDDLWDPEGFAGVIGRDEPYLWYAYPPFFAAAWTPLTALPIDAAWLVWTAVGLAAIPVAVRLGAGRWHGPATLMALAWYPAALNFQLGQNAALAALIVAVAVALVRQRHPVIGGVVLGLLVFKPQLAIGVGVWWLVEPRHRRAAVAAVSTAISIMGVSWIVSPDAWRSYGTTAFEVASVPTQILQVSLPGFFELAFPGWDLARLVGLLISAGLLLAFAGWLRQRPRDFESALAVAIMVTLLAAPYLLVYDYVIATAPLVLLHRQRDLTGMWVPAAVLSWIVLYTYVIRGVATDIVGVPIQTLPIVLTAVLAIYVRRERTLPARHRIDEATGAA